MRSILIRGDKTTQDMLDKTNSDHCDEEGRLREGRVLNGCSWRDFQHLRDTVEVSI